MREDVTERVLDEAYYIAETGATVRKTAALFLYSKSTVHKDVTERLYGIDKELYERVRKALDKNLAERHIRGGEATKEKYNKKRDIPLTRKRL
ncbi:MAG: sporulation transcriptional regulator SpoIIID [Clostridia bacterium]|nr:sporulation transcriptional regulator SpoIIID [Clostridia bacterium]